MDFSHTIASLLGTAVQGVRVSSPVANHYVQYLGVLLREAVGRWVTVASSGVVCSLALRGPDGEERRCGSPGIGACMVCGTPVCIEHAFVSPGELVCVACADWAAKRWEQDGRSKQRWRGPGADSSPFGFVDPEEQAEERELRRKYLRVLGLKQDASEAEIQSAYKRLAREHHPDRAPPSKRKAKERKLKQINEARDWLTKRDRRAA